ncbi:MAG: hypothetical protein CVV13_07985 [Gammaproteobacteria bacterium HGW-Gammaproteobacteria-3]|nr:MAG: hypothetical protein CVV13_07985 [Gammaproteobacteria bacterium HGW-Gammaproteobacteria-3]
MRYALDSGSAPGFSGRRDDLAQAVLTKTQIQKLAALDEEALIYVLDLDWLDPELTQDDDSQPIQKWWWHLGKIRAKIYPAEVLPEHLRAVYLEAEKT